MVSKVREITEGAEHKDPTTKSDICTHQLVDSANRENANPSTTSTYDRLQQYRFEDMVAKGGMGIVYQAQDLLLNRRVAIKVISSKGHSPALLDEARLACQVNHPNIVTIFDIITTEGDSFLIMEWVDGVTLDKYLPESGLSIDATLTFAIQIAKGLESTHTQQIVHRDIKPNNIIVTSQRHIKILDFGIAKLLYQRNSHPDSSGTPGYMSPEQMLGKSTDQTTDIYAFGKLFYFMLFADNMYTRVSEAEILTRLQNKTIEEIATKPCYNLTAKFICRTLQPDPKKRPQSMSSVLTELEHIQAATQTPQSMLARYPALILYFVLTALLPACLYLYVLLKDRNDTYEHAIKAARLLAFTPLATPVQSQQNALNKQLNFILSALSNEWSFALDNASQQSISTLPMNDHQPIAQPGSHQLFDFQGVDLLISSKLMTVDTGHQLRFFVYGPEYEQPLKTIDVSIKDTNLQRTMENIKAGLRKALYLSKNIARQNNVTPFVYDDRFIRIVSKVHPARSKGELESAIQVLSGFLHDKPAHATGHIYRLNLNLKLIAISPTADVLSAFNQHLREYQRHFPETQYRRYFQSQYFIALKQNADALKVLESNAQLYPEHMATHLTLATLYKDIDNSVAQESSLLKAHKIAPLNIDILLSLARFYIAEDNLTMGLLYYQKGIELAPYNPIVLSALAHINRDLQRFGEAQRYAGKLVKTTPAKYEYELFADILMASNQQEYAATAYRGALALSPNDDLLWSKLGLALKHSDPKKSQIALNKALTLAAERLAKSPEDTQAKVQRILHLARLQRYAQAHHLINRLPQNEAFTGTDYLILAQSLAELGQYTRALTYLVYAHDKGVSINTINNIMSPYRKESSAVFSRWVREMRAPTENRNF
ncbi:protein kinase [Pseudoalteromonas sp. DL2-H2.2]|uniref:serine/threonine-protein kinase n=1 Tax=Pseudoalteromonas sp. DL2-H2.2 TaxID=2908889 RepID=UPI001F25DAC1|nr:serine/threonine-protein kinase [Pseudoalteromonas sp. DL2-H2.2]MCF2909474.1 protein kinase [Pseudoalteromonas sp. DL2-H2.2]